MRRSIKTLALFLVPALALPLLATGCVGLMGLFSYSDDYYDYDEPSQVVVINNESHQPPPRTVVRTVVREAPDRNPGPQPAVGRPDRPGRGSGEVRQNNDGRAQRPSPAPEARPQQSRQERPRPAASQSPRQERPQPAASQSPRQEMPRPAVSRSPRQESPRPQPASGGSEQPEERNRRGRGQRSELVGPGRADASPGVMAS
ncbi:MAG: hypothetical protein LBP95_02635 [Deltaproteobacteria bacterium]|jgi:hypothetical protein|nr:hypothetical protein [Deltaproteobacteria bacterium]